MTGRLPRKGPSCLSAWCRQTVRSETFGSSNRWMRNRVSMRRQYWPRKSGSSSRRVEVERRYPCWLPSNCSFRGAFLTTDTGYAPGRRAPQRGCRATAPARSGPPPHWLLSFAAQAQRDRLAPVVLFWTHCQRRSGAFGRASNSRAFGPFLANSRRATACCTPTQVNASLPGVGTTRQRNSPASWRPAGRSGGWRSQAGHDGVRFYSLVSAHSERDVQRDIAARISAPFTP